MSPRRAVAGAVGLLATVVLNLSWIALVGLAALAVVVFLGRAVVAVFGGG